MLTGIPCTLMRGGTSKGLYFHALDLPSDRELRDRVLLAAMGSPDIRQIDGVGGAHPLTSKVAVISKSSLPNADVDYLFLQVVVDKAEVSDSQNCGNILAGVGPWAIEQGMVKVSGATKPFSKSGLCPSGAGSARRSIFPFGSVGNRSNITKEDGTMYSGRFSLRKRRSSLVVADHPWFNTK